jgi:hypothetical protein
MEFAKDDSRLRKEFKKEINKYLLYRLSWAIGALGVANIVGFLIVIGNIKKSAEQAAIKSADQTAREIVTAKLESYEMLDQSFKLAMDDLQRLNKEIGVLEVQHENVAKDLATISESHKAALRKSEIATQQANEISTRMANTNRQVGAELDRLNDALDSKKQDERLQMLTAIDALLHSRDPDDKGFVQSVIQLGTELRAIRQIDASALARHEAKLKLIDKFFEFVDNGPDEATTLQVKSPRIVLVGDNKVVNAALLFQNDAISLLLRNQHGGQMQLDYRNNQGTVISTGPLRAVENQRIAIQPNRSGNLRK